MNDNTANLAIFCDFENVALGAKEAKFDDFEINLVLERVLDKGRVLVKKSYADWQRYKHYRRHLHEAGFELFEVPHARYSGKNSADIHMVCDALDLCYSRPHVNTFVIISGDSDFSPLVRRLRENNKVVIGVGVKHTSSNLLIESCDEYIFYDDLVRRKMKAPRKGASNSAASKKPTAAKSASSKKADATKTDTAKTDTAKPDGAKSDAAKPDTANDADVTRNQGGGNVNKLGDKAEAMELLLDICESLFQERDGLLWGSMVKQVLKRKKPSFDESYYGFRTFSALLEDAQVQGLVELVRDEKSGGYQIRGFGPNA